MSEVFTNLKNNSKLFDKLVNNGNTKEHNCKIMEFLFNLVQEEAAAPLRENHKPQNITLER